MRCAPRELPAIALGLRLSSGNIGSDLMIKIMRTSKTLELMSREFCVMRDDILPPTGVKPSVRDEGDEAWMTGWA